MEATPTTAPGFLAGVREEFDRCWPWLDAANQRAGAFHSRETVWNSICNGSVQFWPYSRCAGVTYIIFYPNDVRVLRLWLIGGELEQILENEPAIAAWAKSVGCVALDLVGRRGWEKTLAAAGYEPEAITMTRRL